MKILLVDDSKMMRKVQLGMLEKLGATFFEAGDGAEALTIWHRESPIDLIVADWNMPNMDGCELTKAIRQSDKTTPILMCTTEAEKPRILEALKSGVSNYVVKPFTPEVFIQKIVQTLKSKKAA